MKNIVLCTVAALTFGLPAFATDSTPSIPSTTTLPEVSVNAIDPVAFRGLSSGAFLLRRESTNDDLAIDIVLSGSATNGVDYATVPTTVTIPAGFFTLGVPINPIGTAFADQSVTLTIKTNANYVLDHPSHASVTIKANAYEDQPPVVSITSPADNTGIPSHTDLVITADASDPNDSVKKVSFYAGDRFLGSLTTSPYTLTWSNVPPGNFSLFARAEDKFGKSTLSSPVHISATNPPPSTSSVTLTAPASGASFGPGSTIGLAATVTGANVVKSVSFYSGDTLLGSDDTAPYTFDWLKVPPGHYTLRAKVTDTGGAVATSDPVKVTVTNGIPKVTLTAPADHAIIPGPTDITVSADASETGGTISKVTFYGDTKSLGSMTTAPYSVTWTNVAPGKHIILATATDSYGAFTSSAITITVSNPPPTVKLTAPADASTFTAPATFDLTADAIDSDGIKYVSFWVGDRRLGADTTAPYSLTVSNLPPGSYTFRAHVVDSYGERAISDPVKVTVTKP